MTRCLEGSCSIQLSYRGADPESSPEGARKTCFEAPKVLLWNSRMSAYTQGKVSLRHPRKASYPNVLCHDCTVSDEKPSSNNPYGNPELFRFTGSMEGVPDVLDVAETAAERAARQGWRATGHSWLEAAGRITPGLAIAFALALFGDWLSRWIGQAVLGLDESPISPILIAIIGGLLIRNTLGLPSVYEAGLVVCLKKILRFGVALLGIRISLLGIGEIGLTALTDHCGLYPRCPTPRQLGQSRPFAAGPSGDLDCCGNRYLR